MIFKQQEIDVGKEGDNYYVDFNGDRLLVSKKLSDIVNRIEQELLNRFGIEKKGGFSGLFKK